MSATVEGFETLCERIRDLSKAMSDFCLRDHNQPLPDVMRERLKKLVE